MQAKLGFNGFQSYQTVFTKTIPQSESQECVVPDSLPDVAAILCAGGCVMIRSKDVSEGHIRLESNVPARIYCAGEGDGLRFCLDVNIPFYISVEDPAIRDDSVCIAELVLRRLEARMLNPRKLSVRAEISAAVTAYAEADTTFSAAPEEETGTIHVLQRECPLSVVTAVTEKTFALTDEFELPSDRASAEEIISQTADIDVQELRCVGSKVILKGVVKSALICSTESGDLMPVEFQTEFSQIVETGTETDECLCDVRILTSGMYYEILTGGEGRSFSMELHLVAQLAVYAGRQIRYLADAYSNCCELQLQRQERQAEQLGREVILKSGCSFALDVPGEVTSVIACYAAPTEWSICSGEISVQLLLRLCWQCGTSYASMERTVTHRFTPDTGGEEIRLCAVTVQNVTTAVSGGDIEVRVMLQARAFTQRQFTIDCISSIEYEENAATAADDRPTLVILHPRSQPDLWTLARENCSTVEAILAANGEEALNGERCLLIPKTI